MSVDRPTGWTDVVRQYWPQTQGYLLASTEPCLSIREEELAAVRDNRVLVGIGFDELAAWTPPESWLLGVVVCPKDELGPLVSWLKGRKQDAHRIHLYLHPETPWSVLISWQEAGLPVDRVDVDVDSWPRLHKLFGLALNDRVYADADADAATV